MRLIISLGNGFSIDLYLGLTGCYLLLKRSFFRGFYNETWQKIIKISEKIQLKRQAEQKWGDKIEIDMKREVRN